ncbi:MAG: GyrI-like domain-containing protein [Anaerolineae bacterium]|nr:GyrI-like domain-containing protein [Anaerolineae bacterium]
MDNWKTLSRRTILDYSKFLRVEEHRVELPDGRVIANWPWIVTPDYVNVVAITPENRFLCFRQTKYAIDGTTLAPIGGYIESGETPLECAQRELLEETGCIADEWIDLGAFWVDPNRGIARGNFFLARGARRVQVRNADDLEEQELLQLTRAQVEDALARGEFKVIAWQAIVALSLLYLDRTSQSKEDIMPEIKRFPTTRVAFVSEVGPFNEAIPRGFQRLFAWLGAHNISPTGKSLGIFHDDPAKVPAEQLRSEMCVPVAPDVQGSGEVQVKEIAEFEAATIVYQGSANVTRAYNAVYDWLRAQGYRGAGSPIEVYLSQPGEELRAEIFVPIVKVDAKETRKVAKGTRKDAKETRKDAKETRKVAKKSVKTKTAAKKPAKKGAKK